MPNACRMIQVMPICSGELTGAPMRPKTTHGHRGAGTLQSKCRSPSLIRCLPQDSNKKPGDRQPSGSWLIIVAAIAACSPVSAFKISGDRQNLRRCVMCEEILVQEKNRLIKKLRNRFTQNLSHILTPVFLPLIPSPPRLISKLRSRCFPDLQRWCQLTQTKGNPSGLISLAFPFL